MDLIIPSKMYMNYNIDGLLWRISKIQLENVVRLDLNKVFFVRPEYIILLITLSREIYIKTGTAVEWININNEVHSYLERMELRQIDFINIPPIRKPFQWKKSYRDSLNLTELQIIKQHNDCEIVRKRIKEILIKWFPEKLGQDYYKRITTLITEIAGNSLDHSSDNLTAQCYFLAQKYAYKSNTNVVISFGDAGIGIRKSLKKANEWLANDDLYAIKKAFLEGASGRLDRSGGLGFRHVKADLEKYGGEVIIRSGTGALCYDPKRNEKTITHVFRNYLPGTQTAFIL